MKYSKLVMLGLTGVLTFGAVGCTNKTAKKTEEKSNAINNSKSR